MDPYNGRLDSSPWSASFALFSHGLRINDDMWPTGNDFVFNFGYSTKIRYAAPSKNETWIMTANCTASSVWLSVELTAKKATIAYNECDMAKGIYLIYLSERPTKDPTMHRTGCGTLSFYVYS